MNKYLGLSGLEWYHNCKMHRYQNNLKRLSSFHAVSLANHMSLLKVLIPWQLRRTMSYTLHIPFHYNHLPQE